MGEYRAWLAEMYRAMDFLMRSGCWGAVNAYLLEQQHRKSDPTHTIAILRFLSSAPREKLPEWERLLERTGIAIDALGLDRKRMLRGLVRYDDRTEGIPE